MWFLDLLPAPTPGNLVIGWVAICGAFLVIAVRKALDRA